MHRPRVNRPRRRFGQHFLVDRQVGERMVAAFAPAAGQLVVEIGPGRGALTHALAASGAAVTAVEIDRDLARALRQRCPAVTVINADILDFDWRALGDGDGHGEGHCDGGGGGDGHGGAHGEGHGEGHGDGHGDGDAHGEGDGEGHRDGGALSRHPRSPHHRHPRSLLSGGGHGEGHRDGDGHGEGHRHSDSGERAQPKLRLIGNLPYNIATELIFRLLAHTERIADMQFMVQREVAQRLCAPPGGKNYGRLTVLTALQLDCAALFEVPPGAFNPPPQVDSTVVRLTPKARPLRARDARRLEAVVAAAFGQRRKTLRNALAGAVAPAQFARAGIDPGLRAEKLSAADFIALADAADG